MLSMLMIFRVIMLRAAHLTHRHGDFADGDSRHYFDVRRAYAARRALSLMSIRYSIYDIRMILRISKMALRLISIDD
jgi:hypothetical protein